MDTQRIPEWNCWYHIMNCGFPLKVSGETDFPCISGSRVGQGRVYVQLGKVDKIDFGAWCEGLAKGRSYVSDGYAHALEFTVAGKPAGERGRRWSKPGKVAVKAKVAFAAEMPLGTSDGGQVPQGKTRKVELIVNGVAVASKEVPADDRPHDICVSTWTSSAAAGWPCATSRRCTPTRSMWSSAGKPIRASRKSALWCRPPSSSSGWCDGTASPRRSETRRTGRSARPSRRIGRSLRSVRRGVEGFIVSRSEYLGRSYP